MLGEVSLFGVYLPALMLMALGSAILTGLATRLLQRFDMYRFTAGRPITDLSIFALILGAVVRLSSTVR